MEHLQNFETYFDKINEDIAGGEVSSMPTSMDSNSQPASLSGKTINPGYDGKDGGYTSNPLNMGTGKANVYQKEPGVRKSRSHGSVGERKSRKSEAQAALKNIFSKKQDFTAGEGEIKEPTVMNFSDFENKGNITRIKKEI
jgi:hypothetical protein